MEKQAHERDEKIDRHVAGDAERVAACDGVDEMDIRTAGASASFDPTQIVSFRCLFRQSSTHRFCFMIF